MHRPGERGRRYRFFCCTAARPQAKKTMRCNQRGYYRRPHQTSPLRPMRRRQSGSGAKAAPSSGKQTEKRARSKREDERRSPRRREREREQKKLDEPVKHAQHSSERSWSEATTNPARLLRAQNKQRRERLGMAVAAEEVPAVRGVGSKTRVRCKPLECDLRVSRRRAERGCPCER